MHLQLHVAFLSKESSIVLQLPSYLSKLTINGW